MKSSLPEADRLNENVKKNKNQYLCEIPSDS